MSSTLSLDRLDSLSAATLRVAQIDLSGVRLKLSDPEEGVGWCVEKLDVVERLYRQFLVLNCLYPHAAIVPTGDIDAFWHAHILDTRAYAADTERVFGYFLHHYPYFGLLGPEDRDSRNTAFENTNLLYQTHFGVLLADTTRAVSCKSSCSSCASRN